MVSRDLRFLSLGVVSVRLSVCLLALPVAAVVTAVIHWERLCTVALSQNVSDRDYRLLLLLFLILLLHGAEPFCRT